MKGLGELDGTLVSSVLLCHRLTSFLNRFQLFGDTVNTTARIETTGAKNRVHLSEETAQLLIGHGKQHEWLDIV